MQVRKLLTVEVGKKIKLTIILYLNPKQASTEVVTSKLAKMPGNLVHWDVIKFINCIKA